MEVLNNPFTFIYFDSFDWIGGQQLQQDEILLLSFVCRRRCGCGCCCSAVIRMLRD